MLTIYRASAGAGKTHKLTGEYLKLLFSQPGAYRRILAVTFTNKATDEMKSRIIHELYQLAAGKPSDYLQLLTSCYPTGEAALRKQAKQLLTSILNDYSAFSVSTIDRFFQQTMRAFTREIGLQGGYNIEMDQERVLNEAIDRLLTDLDQPGHEQLLEWLLRFSEEKIESGGEWNLRKDIRSLSRELFKESYQLASEQVSRDIADKSVLLTYKKQLYELITNVENQTQSLGKKALCVMEEYGMKPTDFKGGSRSPMLLFEKWANGELKEPSATFMAMADNLNGCLTKSMKKSQQELIGCVFENGLNRQIKKAVNHFSHLENYYTAKEIARYYYTLGILMDVSQQIAAYREEHNLMLIADTNELLHKVIAGNETPFIYEKTGTYIDHFMIDEFQDTSRMQWNNFRPLIAESLSNQRDNLVVGDVKQSIYRFRNSDWKLLDEQLQQHFRSDEVRVETLRDNWRSCRHIVEFNNALFTAAPAILQNSYNEVLESSSLPLDRQDQFKTKLMRAYGHCYQQVPRPMQDKEGHVRIQFMESTEEQDWKEQALDQLPGWLQTLQQQGYALRDIAILVRTNAEGARVASHLLQYKETHAEDGYRYDVISDEALYINSSPAVRFLIALLHYLKDPENTTLQQLAFYAHEALAGTVGSRTLSQPLWEALGIESAQWENLTRQPLYETVEGLYRLFDSLFPDREQVFLQALLDQVAEFKQQEGGDLTHFLKWWDETGQSKTIATPDGQNAIRILTVHKSKGLGFKAVIIPFGDWEIDHKPMKSVILWCHPTREPFNRLHTIPVRYGQSLSKTIFAEAYFQERLHAYIDNLNTLYVALTRAKEELLIMAPRPRKLDSTGDVSRISSIGDLLWASLRLPVNDTAEGEPFKPLPADFDRETGCFERGTWWKPETHTSGTDAEEILMQRIQVIPSNDRLQLRLRGKNYFFDNPQRKHGTLMHELLSSIRTVNDILPAMEHYCQTGVVDRNEADQLIIRLNDLLQQPQVAAWYDGTAQVLNETDILIGKGHTKRPDRVIIKGKQVTVIDYKFGQKQLRAHQQQVQEYLQLIRKMGYPQVEGYLWYVELNKIMPVNS